MGVAASSRAMVNFIVGELGKVVAGGGDVVGRRRLFVLRVIFLRRDAI